MPAPMITGGAAPPPRPTPERMGGMNVPTDPRGMMESTKVNMKIAMTLMEQSLAIFGAGTEEGGAIMKALMGLSKIFGKAEQEDLTRAQLMNMFSESGMKPPGGPPQGGPGGPGGPAGGPAPGGPGPGGGVPPELMQKMMG